MPSPSTTSGPGFLARLLLALFVPWKILFDRAFAEQVEQLAGGEPASALPPSGRPLVAHHLPEATEEHEEPQDETSPVAEEESAPDATAALQILAILQREGRLLDFLQEDVTAASDADIGAAARVVHEGCRRALGEYVELEPVVAMEEGSPVTIQPGFDPGEVRLTGNVVGRPPYKGLVAHPGWRASRFDLPARAPGVDHSVVAPAEVEVQG